MVISRHTSNASTVLSSNCIQRAPRFKGIQVVSKRFKHTVLCAQWEVKGLKGTVVNLSLPTLHDRKVTWKVTVTVPLIIFLFISFSGDQREFSNRSTWYSDQDYIPLTRVIIYYLGLYPTHQGNYILSRIISHSPG